MYSLQHVRYAAPAFICIIVFVVLPTVLLLWYPSGSRLLSFCSLRDNVLIMCLNKLVPLHKLKPFFDSFQSCFRDHLRFFSGLYFSYRIILIAAYTLSVGITQFYILVEMLLITMLMLHALAQPYKTKWHNVTDALIFSNLTFINALSLFIYIKSPEKIYKEIVVAAIHIQSFLVFLPLLVISLFLTFHMVIKLKQSDVCKWLSKSRCRSVNDHMYILSNEFPPRLVESDDSDESIDYSLIN